MIEALRKNKNLSMLVVGNHHKIVQSILDFDYTAGKQKPSVCAIVTSGRRAQKFFWGNGEILIPVFQSIEAARTASLPADLLLNITSASSTSSMVEGFFTAYPEAIGAHLFAEDVPERRALAMIEQYGKTKLIAGPSGVGLCVPTVLKLGAIGGIAGPQIAELAVRQGTVAIICSSGGMVNELIYQVMHFGSGISFAVSYGGDRFPVTSALDWVLQAEADPLTKEIIFFGELGGKDEYAIRDAIKEKRVTKPMYAYIAGHYESSTEKVQFGHAKALAKEESETALAKMAALEAVGVKVGRTFQDFMQHLGDLTKLSPESSTSLSVTDVSLQRTHTYFSSPRIAVEAFSFTEAILKRILQRNELAPETVAYVDHIFQELLDHGPNVSGAINTIVTARAGRDLVSSLASGLLTIGDRFGGAINEAAKLWFTACSEGVSPSDLVKDYSGRRVPIPGIGHLKYSRYDPDPRIATLLTIADFHIENKIYLSYAQAVAKLTLEKKQNLILNIDGVIAATMLDYLTEQEECTEVEIKQLIDIEFFNSLFVIARSVGFIGHYLDQRRVDEGLFRLDDKDIYFS